MHPVLLAIVQDVNLTDSAKGLAAALYARTNGTLRAGVDAEELAAQLGLGLGSLRRRRAELAARGWLVSRLEGGWLEFELGPQGTDGERAPSARLEDEVRAPSARLDGEVRAPTARQRAPSARLGAVGAHLVRAAERDDAQNPPTPPHRNSLKEEEEVKLTSSYLEGGAGGNRGAHLLRAVGVAPEIAAELGARLAFETVVRHVAAWQVSAAERGLGVGSLVMRLRRWPAPPGVLAEDLQAGVLAGVVTDEDLAGWGVERPRGPLEGYDVPRGYERWVKS